MVTWEKQLACCTKLPQALSAALRPGRAPRDRPCAATLLSGEEQLSRATFPWKRDSSLGHTSSEAFKLSHNRESPGPLPVRVQSLSVAGLAGLGRIKPLSFCVRRAAWISNQDSGSLVVFPQVRDHGALAPDTAPSH